MQPITNKGSIALLALIFFGVFFTLSVALINYLTVYLRSERVAVDTAQALALAEAGFDHAVYQLNHNPGYTGEVNTAYASGTFTIVISNNANSSKQVTVTANIPNSASPRITKQIVATAGVSNTVVSFRYGIQTGAGGFVLNNSSQIVGNVYANGPVTGTGNNMIYGDVVSAGASGQVYGIHATSSIYAHTIGTAGTPTTADRDAYYVSKTNTTVSGTLHPGSTDLPTAAFPLSDTLVTQWEQQAEAGGTISSCDAQGDYNITSSMSLGPKKIACNLVVKSASGVLTITGPIWVTGNITTQTGPTIRIDPTLGNTNVGLVADNPNNTTGSGIISVGQSTVFNGSGQPGSYVFLISQNNSAETGGATVAVSLSQGASALVAYAGHGLMNLGQSVNIKEGTAYKIVMSQSASITYDTGLPTTIFESGAGGSYVFTPGTYSILQ